MVHDVVPRVNSKEYRMDIRSDKTCKAVSIRPRIIMIDIYMYIYVYTYHRTVDTEYDSSDLQTVWYNLSTIRLRGLALDIIMRYNIIINTYSIRCRTVITRLINLFPCSLRAASRQIEIQPNFGIYFFSQLLFAIDLTRAHTWASAFTETLCGGNNTHTKRILTELDQIRNIPRVYRFFEQICCNGENKDTTRM